MHVIGGVQEMAGRTGNRNGALAEVHCVARLTGVCKRPVRRNPGVRAAATSGVLGPVTPVFRRIPCTAASHLTRAATVAVPVRLPRAGGPSV